MSEINPQLLDDLRARSLVNQMTGDDQLVEHLKESRTLYCGFDPTADSLHIGSLVPLLALRRFQQAGHKPIALVGGATGLIGDPSFKAQERKLNSADVVSQWTQKIKGQVSKFIEFDQSLTSAEVVNNLDWAQEIDLVSFLRDIGKHFSVNNMINKESVKQRLDREGAGISYTEFTYMLLQSYDFAELYKRFGCTLQLGGSDQWGNIVGGVDLSRKLYSGHVFGLTLPLVTKSDGTKFGKTESGTIWLDSSKTSPYSFYQFWLNTADADVYKFLKYFTFLDVAQINDIEKSDAEASGRPEGQAILAKHVTEIVHGENGYEAAKRITDAMFSGDTSSLAEEDLAQLALDGLPSSKISYSEAKEKPLTSLLVECGMVSAGREVKDALGRSAVWVNGAEKSQADNMAGEANFAQSNSRYGRYFLIKLGKKKNHLIEVEY
ncbi:tyrosine--tRNA ligase [Sessilibacter corallicola]|uniref:Tyrosine--tRNA ligase n=1 Tax=Sessilibacter corallicola TaxID=2904075 RepID=A0ABQ0A8Z5_9GAMM